MHEPSPLKVQESDTISWDITMHSRNKKLCKVRIWWKSRISDHVSIHLSQRMARPGATCWQLFSSKLQAQIRMDSPSVNLNILQPYIVEDHRPHYESSRDLFFFKKTFSSKFLSIMQLLYRKFWIITWRRGERGQGTMALIFPFPV